MRKTYNVPGASLAVLVDGEIKALACGLLHQGTGVEATTDSLFQIGSICKVYTAALVMQLVDLCISVCGIDRPTASNKSSLGERT